MFPPKPTDAGASGQQPPALPELGAPMPTPGTFSDAQLLDMWKRWKKESFDQRWIFERQWMRNVWYILNRQWIYFDSKKGQWQDKRLAKWIPRPVTNILKDGVQAVRANFASINYGANARPLGDDNKNVITAGVADDYAPILHEDHQMDLVMGEFDFWTLVTGNAWLHTCVDYDRKHGVVNDQINICGSCQQEVADSKIADAGQKCPACGQPGPFTPASNEDGTPKVITKPLPKGITLALSPFEIAYPLVYERFSMVPYVIRMRWRDKTYYEQTEGLQQYAKSLSFSKTPAERTMQIFKTLPYQNDLGIAMPFSGGANTDSEGIVEYDVWVKPCADFPEGQVIRFAGDSQPVVIHAEQESLPGPLPYTDAKGKPFFPFHHGYYEHVGGRSLGSALIDPGVGKQDSLNQIDSHIQMTIGRMANPVWLEPKGAEVEKFTGEPGLVVKWNPLIAGGNAKPERIPGEGINESVFAYREMVKAELEELLGTNDILKGQRPPNIDSFAGMQLMVERGQAKHTSAYKSRGSAYKGWFKDALEIEREFGLDDRVKAIMMPSRGWAFENFKKADLSGEIEIIIEDGTLTPKTALGDRAAIEHLRQLGFIDPTDQEQKMAIFEKFGQSSLLPGLDAQMQEAWMIMDKFEKFLGDPQAIQTAIADVTNPNPGPLVYRRWYDPQIHRQQLIKWCLSDRGRDVFAKSPAALGMVDAYLSQIDIALAMQAQGMIDAGGEVLPTKPPTGAGNPKEPGGAGAGMANSNRNAAGAGPKSSGAAGTSQNNTQGNQPQGNQPPAMVQ